MEPPCWPVTFSPSVLTTLMTVTLFRESLFVLACFRSKKVLTLLLVIWLPLSEDDVNIRSHTVSCDVVRAHRAGEQNIGTRSIACTAAAGDGDVHADDGVANAGGDENAVSRIGNIAANVEDAIHSVTGRRARGRRAGRRRAGRWRAGRWRALLVHHLQFLQLRDGNRQGGPTRQGAAHRRHLPRLASSCGREQRHQGSGHGLHGDDDGLVGRLLSRQRAGVSCTASTRSCTRRGLACTHLRRRRRRQVALAEQVRAGVAKGHSGSRRSRSRRALRAAMMRARTPLVRCCTGCARHG